MTSRFGWLDTDEDQRRQMMEVVELFRDEGSVDELGIGTVRDTIANALFPGTSVLYTRLRYVLFVPWLVEQVAASARTSARAVQDLRRAETRLIEALIAGTADGDGDEAASGIIGRRARARLKNMPSTIYWGALGVWGIRTWDDGVEGHLRRSIGLRAVARARPPADDPESRDDLAVSGFAPDLPRPPEGLLRAADFRLTPEEAEFVAHRIQVSTSGSLLAWLAANPPRIDVDAVWELPGIAQAPAPMVEVVDHGRRLSVLMAGAALLYNLVLAEQTSSELADVYRADLVAWQHELHAPGVLDDWDARDFRAVLARHNPRITTRTRQFVDAWRDTAGNADDVAASTACRDLVRLRERQIKGARARIGNRAALDRWSGASGLGRLDYRWGTVQRLVADLAPDLEVSGARS